MATVILARHGRTTANASGVLAGRGKGVHLDEHGLEQARAAGQRLAGLPLAAIVTSPLERCKETAREISRLQPTALRVAGERGLLECDYGSWTGRELKSLAKEKLWQTVQAHPSNAHFPEGESMAAMMARSVAAIRAWDAEVEAEHGADAVWLAVSHGDVIKSVLADALGMHLDLFQRIVVEPASLSVVRYTPLRPFVVSVNSSSGDLSGLKPPARRRRRKLDSDAVVGGSTGTTAVDPVDPVDSMAAGAARAPGAGKT
ncbi:MAG TPA: histidine phosphatase family protein [Nocardioidaceae bacterium]|nr:histidine phosphatase family protein [Nocardioidaceae bacterium]